jgi:hypothetical protein
MTPQNRDLLVLTKKDIINPDELEHEVQLLVDILYQAERIDAFCIANEVLDLKRYRVIQKPHLIQKIIREKKTKPFIFISNKN